MDLTGKKLDLLERADECARILGHPKHAANRFTLTPGERGIAVALQEYVETQLAALRSEFAAYRHGVNTKGDAE